MPTGGERAPEPERALLLTVSKSGAMTIDGALVAHEPFAAQPAGKRALAYVYPLHSGSWLGIPGRTLMMLSAATMPALFAIGLVALTSRRSFLRTN